MARIAAQENIALLGRCIHGYKISRMLGLAAELGVADCIPGDQLVPASSLAAEVRVLASPLLRLCRALASFGIFTVTADDMIGHSQQSVLLRTDSVPSLRHAAWFFSASPDWAAWGGLDQVMRGVTPFEALWGSKRFAYMEAHPEDARLFDAVMANSPDDRLSAVAAGYDFSSASLIVDVGGGNGALLRAILSRHSQPRGIVFDREDVVHAISGEGRAGGRIEVAPGDFFVERPPTADIYLLSWVLHDWPDNECRQILSNCRGAMELGARILLVERVLQVDPSKGDPMDYLGDMQMMVIHGSRERTEAEFQTLLASTGFGPLRLIQTASTVWIMESIAT